MHTFYTDCLNNLQELHKEVENAIDGLPPEALDWSPKDGVNSITALVVHIAGAERFLFGEVIAGQSFDRDRDAEFQMKDIAPDALIQRLADSRAYIKSVLEPLTLADLEAKRAMRTREVTVGWVLGHALKHTATHLGHIQVMRDLWEQFKAEYRLSLINIERMCINGIQKTRPLRSVGLAAMFRDNEFRRINH